MAGQKDAGGEDAGRESGLAPGLEAGPADQAETGAGAEPEPGEDAGPEPARTDALPPKADETPAQGVAGRRRVSPAGLILAAFAGGLLAAAVSLAIAFSLLPDPSAQIAGFSARLAEMRLAIEAQATRARELAATIEKADLPALPARLKRLEDVSGELSSRLDDLSARLEGLDETTGRLADDVRRLGSRLDALTARVGKLEKRPVTAAVSPEAVAAYESELARLRQQVETQRAELEKVLAAQRAELQRIADEARRRQESAEQAARRAAARAALGAIAAAITDGRPYSDALAALRAAGVSDIPEPLAAHAETGVASAASLRADFPEAARAALAAARAATPLPEDAPLTERMLAFLKRHLNMRSTVPRPGDDPDAILARAAAALDEDRLDAALHELESLPPAARVAMDSWLRRAVARRDALAALASLTQEPGGEPTRN